MNRGQENLDQSDDPLYCNFQHGNCLSEPPSYELGGFFVYGSASALIGARQWPDDHPIQPEPLPIAP